MFPEVYLSSPKLTSSLDIAPYFPQKISLNGGQIQGFISGDIEKANKLSLVDEIVMYNFPKHKKPEALGLISMIIDFDLDSGNNEMLKLMRMKTNFHTLKSMMDDQTRDLLNVQVNMSKGRTEFYVEDIMISFCDCIVPSSETPRDLVKMDSLDFNQYA